jgi:hypothetical protein
MSKAEIRAVVLTFVGLLALTVTTCLVLGALDADGTAWGVAAVVLVGFGGFLLSLVVMHYTPPEQRPKKP